MTMRRWFNAWMLGGAIVMAVLSAIPVCLFLLLAWVPARLFKWVGSGLEEAMDGGARYGKFVRERLENMVLEFERGGLSE